MYVHIRKHISYTRRYLLDYCRFLNTALNYNIKKK